MRHVALLGSFGAERADDLVGEGVRAILDATGIEYAAFYITPDDELSLRLPVGDELAAVRDKYFESDLLISCQAATCGRGDEGAHTPLLAPGLDWFWRDRLLRGKAEPAFLLFGVASRFRYRAEVATLTQDPSYRAFAVTAARRAVATTASDPECDRFLTTLGIEHETLPSPAFVAAARHSANGRAHGRMVLNLSESGGGTRDAAGTWQAVLPGLLSGLRRLGRILFVAENAADEAFQQGFAAPQERVFRTLNARDDLDLYRGAKLVISNHPDAAVAAAGGGVPAIVVAGAPGVAELVGLPVFDPNGVDLVQVFRAAARLLGNQETERKRLLALGQETMRRYVSLTGPHLQSSTRTQLLPPEATASMLSPGKGWHVQESSDGHTWRWACGDATLRLHVRERGWYRLTGAWCSLGVPDSIRIELSAEVAHEFRIEQPGFQEIPSLEFFLPRGLTTLRITNARPAYTPAGDSRLLAFALRDPRVEPAEIETTVPAP